MPKIIAGRGPTIPVKQAASGAFAAPARRGEKIFHFLVADADKGNQGGSLPSS